MFITTKINPGRYAKVCSTQTGTAAIQEDLKELALKHDAIAKWEELHPEKTRIHCWQADSPLFCLTQKGGIKRGGNSRIPRSPSAWACSSWASGSASGSGALLGGQQFEQGASNNLLRTTQVDVDYSEHKAPIPAHSLADDECTQQDDMDDEGSQAGRFGSGCG